MLFQDVRVPVGNVIGAVGEGLKRGLQQIGHVRLAVCATAVGTAAWAIKFVEQQLLQPHRSGTPLAGREGVQLRLADMQIEHLAARALLYRTAALAESCGRDEMEQQTIATKVLCTEMCGRVVDTAVQLCGGGTLRVGHPLERLYRRVREWRFAEGASDLLRIKLAKAALKQAAPKQAGTQAAKSRL
jgi:acyl-CoA dehydrogenase